MPFNVQGVYIDKPLGAAYSAQRAAQTSGTLQAGSAAKREKHASTSTLASAAQATDQSVSCISRLWAAVRSFFSCLCCSKAEQMDVGGKEKRLGEIAKQHQFVWFYDERQNPLTSFLGNFYPCKVKVWGIEFACAEAAFQAGKFSPNRAIMATFSQLTGEQAFQRAKKLTAGWTPAQKAAWQAKNIQVMDDVLMAKFSQTPPLKRLLLATDKASLIEHAPVIGRDAFWADNGDGTGQNKLGERIMRIRALLGGHGFQPRPRNYNPRACV